MGIGEGGKMRITNQGMTLIELMVAVGVIGIIAAISVPMYNDYIATAREGVIVDNMRTIHVFQEERRLDRGEYVEGTYTPGSAGGLAAAASLGWQPRTDSDLITYVITCTTDGAVVGECARGSGYTITGTHSGGGAAVVRTFP
jgi:prepilin-type N-terminal cleavage/methylation domain-containing protein